MRNAETVLAIMRARGSKELPLYDVYRQLFNPDLFLRAYGKIAPHPGAMTKGVTGATVDGMSLPRIERIIGLLREEKYRWTPARRVFIEKPHSTKKRPLGITDGHADKLLQEVIREMLEAYYEPQFDDHSHGFRPQRGCHTALAEITTTWKGTVWFIEGDIKGCFDNIDHDTLLAILGERIKDNRFLRLIGEMLRAGYLEDWHYHRNLSGTPQGAGCSPILANIYLDRLDSYVRDTLVPTHNRGTGRKINPAYDRLYSKRLRRRRAGKIKEANALLAAMRKLPAMMTDDPDYRRLRYIRYADDFLLGFAGPKDEAEAIKGKIGLFLKDSLKLDLVAEKTLVSHAKTKAARFLGYEIRMQVADEKLVQFRGTTKDGHPIKRRNVNGYPRLLVPDAVVKGKMAPYLRRGKSIHRPELLNHSVFDIVSDYGMVLRGIANYYAIANNRTQAMSHLKYVMERSLTATLASKLKISRAAVYEHYKARVTDATTGKEYTALICAVERVGKPPLVAQWGGFALAKVPPRTVRFLNDQPPQTRSGRTQLEQRLLADTCELCGSRVEVEVHHIRALKDLHRDGRKEKPRWVQWMIAHQRKTLVACQVCHTDIHAGRPLRNLIVA